MREDILLSVDDKIPLLSSGYINFLKIRIPWEITRSVLGNSSDILSENFPPVNVEIDGLSLLLWRNDSSGFDNLNDDDILKAYFQRKQVLLSKMSETRIAFVIFVRIYRDPAFRHETREIIAHAVW